MIEEANKEIKIENQIYDSYFILLETFNKDEKEIIIIDNYIDKKILDVLRKIDKDNY